ncbi:MAG: SpoIIE family protein phosphatase [Armatimonadetes bacterium]|nr:SpoIIE family protein phosphatase [Armatimonadota bacterium]
MRTLLEPFAVTELEQSLHAAAREAAAALGADRCTIFVRNSRSAAYSLAAAAGIPAPLRRELADAAFPLQKLPSWVRDMIHRGRSVLMVPRGHRRTEVAGSLGGPDGMLAASPADPAPGDEEEGSPEGGTAAAAAVTATIPEEGQPGAASAARRPVTPHPWHARPVLGVPLASGGETVGLLFAEPGAGVDAADGTHARVGDALAAALGPVVAAAQAWRDEQAELREAHYHSERLLNVAVKTAAHLDVAQVLRAVVRESAAVVGARFGELALIRGQELITVAVYPEERAVPEQCRLGEGIVGQVAASGVPQRHQMLRAQPRPGLDAVGLLSVPVESGGTRLGVLSMYDSRDTAGFSGSDERLLQSIAAYTGGAIQGARRHDPGPAGVKEMDLRNIGLSLGGSLEVEETLQTVAEMSIEMLRAQVCLVLSIREENQMLLVRAACTDTGAAIEASVALNEESLAARAIESGLPAWVEEGVEPPRLHPRALNEQFPIAAGIAVPIRDGARVTGLILAYHSQPRVYTSDEVQLLATLANQANAVLRSSAICEHQRAIAETIQRSLLPHLPETVTGAEFGHAYFPRRDRVGGDYYDLTPLSDGRCGIVVGDVCGSGLQAAIHTAMGKYMLRAFAYEYADPGRVLRRMNDAICAQSRSEVFLTIFYGVLHPSGLLAYANAAHPYPILRRAGRGGTVLLETTGTVVGVIPEQDYQEREIQVNRGDVLLLYTDGIIEAGRHGDLFGLERLQAAVRAWDGTHPQELVDHVMRCVREFCAGQPQDDIALLAMKFR